MGDEPFCPPGFFQFPGKSPNGDQALFLVAQNQLMGHFRDAKNRQKQLEGYLLPEVFEDPTGIWLDLKSPGKGDWYCYASLPSGRFLGDISVNVPIPPRMVFCAYVRGQRASGGQYVVDFLGIGSRTGRPEWASCQPHNAIWETCMATGLGEYYEFLRQGLDAPGEFNPKPYYAPESDTLFFYAEDVQSYAKRFNPILTVILSAADDRLVGFKIKGIRRIVRQMQRLGVDKFAMDDHGIKLRIFAELALVVPPDDPELTRHYEDELNHSFQDVVVDTRELQLR